MTDPLATNVVRLPRRAELEFLPAALEIVETPAPPLGRAIGAVLVICFLAALAWTTIGHVDIIATAQGKIVPVGRVKTIQPLEAGMVAAIHAKDGDQVHEGDVLVELDRTVNTAERNRIGYELLRTRLDVARLAALRRGLETTSAEGFEPPVDAPAYEVARTRAAMNAQAEQQAAKLAALSQQIAQKTAEIGEIAAVIDKLEAGLPLIERAADVREKAMKMEYGNVIAHLDAKLKLSEQRHELVVQQRRAVEIAAAKAGLEAQQEQARAEYARNVIDGLGEAEQKAAQLAEDMVKAEKKLQDQVLRAPIDGTVQQLALHTIGGVVTHAEVLMVVVPADSSIEVEAMIQNQDIGFVHDGDPAEIKVDTFNFTKYGLVHAKVLDVSHDAILRDRPAASRTGASGATMIGSEPSGQELLYAARVALDRTAMEVEGRPVNLAPGMAVTVEIRTGSRRIIEFLLSPVLRYKQESLRER